MIVRNIVPNLVWMVCFFFFFLVLLTPNMFSVPVNDGVQSIHH